MIDPTAALGRRHRFRPPEWGKGKSWGDRSSAALTTSTSVPPDLTNYCPPTARVHFNEAGDVAGSEALGWSQRTEGPADVAVAVHAADSSESLAVTARSPAQAWRRSRGSPDA